MAESKSQVRRIYMSGVFDIANYGDLLFPLLARHRLEPQGYEVRTVTPAGGATHWPDTTTCQSLAELFTADTPVAGLLVGGGNIIYGGVAAQNLLTVPPEGRSHESAPWGAPGLWLGPMLVAAVRDLPIAWNAPGVPHPLAGVWRSLLGAAVAANDYVSVRDEASRDLIAPLSGAEINVVPDTATAIASMWPKASLTPAFRQLLERKAFHGVGRFWVIHIRDRSLGNLELRDLAQWIDTTSRLLGLTPIVLSIGPGFGDSGVSRDLGGHLVTPAIMLDDPQGPREIAAAIAHCDLYAGASLHGYVTAAAYGVPGVLVARPAHRKYAGFLAHIGAEADIRRSWDEAFQSLTSVRRGASGSRIPAAVFDQLDRHWACIAEALASPTRRRAERSNFLRQYLRLGLQRSADPGWLLRPIASRASGRSSLIAKLMSPARMSEHDASR